MAHPDTSEQTTCYRHRGVETGVRCSECERPICADCMNFGPVGIRCPECAGRSHSRPVTERARTVAARAPTGIVTKILIGLNVGVFLLQLASGSGFNSASGRVFVEGALYGPLVADGEWYRMITSAFIHVGFIHLLFNMLILWWFGRNLETVLGPERYLAVYVVSLVAGAAGALLLSPTTPTVGASGAVFGVLGAGLVLERRQVYVFGGGAFAIVAINLVLTFTLGNISIGGHIGGLIGGILAMLVLLKVGRYRSLLSAQGATALAGLAAIVAVSVLVAYLRIRGLA